MNNDKNVDLKPCPNCGCDPYPYFTLYVTCSNEECDMCGPSNDLDGKKWNALPRKETFDPRFTVIDLETGSMFAPDNRDYGFVREYAAQHARETGNNTAIVQVYAIAHPKDVEWSDFMELVMGESYE